MNTFRPPYAAEEVSEVVADLKDLGKRGGWICASVGAEMLERAYSDLKALIAERDSLRKDAERYRWLIDSADEDVCIRTKGTSPTHPHLWAYWQCKEKPSIDAYIDKAIKAQEAEAANVRT